MDDDQYTQEIARELQAREQEEVAFLAAKAIQRMYNQLPDDEFVALMQRTGFSMEDIDGKP